MRQSNRLLLAMLLLAGAAQGPAHSQPARPGYPTYAEWKCPQLETRSRFILDELQKAEERPQDVFGELMALRQAYIGKACGPGLPGLVVLMTPEKIPPDFR